MPVPGAKITAKQATRYAVPSLLVGEHHTEANALHDLIYQGPLTHGSDFLRAVEATHNDQSWSRRVLKYSEPLDEEIVEISNEHGVQGRFLQSFGAVLGHIFKFQSVDLRFANFKSLGSSYFGTPDVILKNANNELKVIGELKVPWVAQHRISDCYSDEIATTEITCSTYQLHAGSELQVQVLCKRVLGPKHPDTLTSMHNLACIYRELGRWKEAEALIIQALISREQVLGPEHTETLSSMKPLASIYYDQHQWNKAESLQMQILDTEKRVLGPEHPDTLLSLNLLAATYREQGKWNHATNIQIQALETSMRVLGPQNADTIANMNSLAWTYGWQGQWKEAEALQIQALETNKKVRGPNHFITMICMRNLAVTLKGLDKHDAAVELMTECERLHQQILGSDHPDTLNTGTYLAEWQDLENMSFGQEPTWIKLWRLFSKS